MTQYGNTLLEVKDLKMHFPIKAGFLQRQVGAVKAVDGVNFTVYPGETLALVGESGCGKTTIGRCLMRAYAPTGGEVIYTDRDGKKVDLTTLSDKQLKQVSARTAYDLPGSPLVAQPQNDGDGHRRRSHAHPQDRLTVPNWKSGSRPC